MGTRKSDQIIKDWCADFEKANPNQLAMTQFFDPEIEKKMLEYLKGLGIATTNDSLYAYMLGMLEGLKHIEPVAKTQGLSPESQTVIFVLAMKIYSLQKYRESREKAMQEHLGKSFTQDKDSGV